MNPMLLLELADRTVDPAHAECSVQGLGLGDAGDAAGLFSKFDPHDGMRGVVGEEPLSELRWGGEGKDDFVVSLGHGHEKRDPSLFR